MNWYLSVMKEYTRFTGRAHRREYWWFFAITMLVSVLVSAVAGIVSDRAANSAGALVALVHLVPSLAVGARRLHDAGLSGWWQLVGLVPGFGGLILLVLLALPVRPRAERFGPPGTEAPRY